MPKHKKEDIYIFLVGNVVWITWAIFRNISLLMVLQFFFVVLNLRILYYWNKEKN